MDTACDKPEVENENVNSNAKETQCLETHEHLSMQSTEMTTNFLTTANTSDDENAIEFTGLFPDVLIEEEDRGKDKEENQIKYLDEICDDGIVHSEICQTVIAVPTEIEPLPIDRKVLEKISVLEEADGNPVGTTLISSSNETGKVKEENQIEYLHEISDDGIIHSDACQTVIAVPTEIEPLPIDRKVLEEISVIEEAVGNPVGTTLIPNSNETEIDIEENQIEYLDEISDDGIVHSEIFQTVIAVPTEIEPLPIDRKVLEEISVLAEAVGTPVGTSLISNSNETGSLY